MTYYKSDQQYFRINESNSNLYIANKQDFWSQNLVYLRYRVGLFDSYTIENKTIFFDPEYNISFGSQVLEILLNDNTI